MTHLPATNPGITCCITELDIGGAEKAFVRVAIGLQQRGWYVRVISLRDEGPLTQPLQTAGIPVTALNGRGFPDFRLFWRLRAELRRHPTDMLLGFLHQANVYGRLAGRSAGIRRIISGIRVADRRAWVTATERLTHGCADHHIAVSQSVADSHAARCHIPRDRITAIPNGVDLPTQEPSANSHRRTDRLLFVGRLTPQKNPLLLLQAFRMLPPEQQQSLTLHYVGDGPLRESLDQKIRDWKLADQVTLVGRSDKIEQLMQEATLLVLPSAWEGLPNVVLEAMACGLPVIATAVDGTRELIHDGHTGWTVPARDPAALSTAIAEALANPDERQRRATQARDMVVRDYRWESVIDTYDRLLRSWLPNDSRQNSG
ncbi:MAG: glycosyltransferase [Fuerstiella sp.]